jgi:hypothetical protein
MLFCFTRTTFPASRLIQRATGEDCSHFAMVFDEDPAGYGLVLHSSFMGVQLAWWGDFQKTHIIAHALAPKVSFTLGQEESLYRAVVKMGYGCGYDYGALAFFGWRYLLKAWSGRPLPARNLWGKPNAYLCTGMAKALANPVFDVLKLSDLRAIPDLEMVSPGRLYAILAKSPCLKDAPEWTQAPSSKSLAAAP